MDWADQPLPMTCPLAMCSDRPAPEVLLSHLTGSHKGWYKSEQISIEPIECIHKAPHVLALISTLDFKEF